MSDPEPELYIPPENLVVLGRRRLFRWHRRHGPVLRKFLLALLLGVANAFVIAALWHHFNTVLFLVNSDNRYTITCIKKNNKKSYLQKAVLVM
jgi:hypothetical protein